MRKKDFVMMSGWRVIIITHHVKFAAVLILGQLVSNFLLQGKKEIIFS